MASRAPAPPDTRTRILDVAERLVQKQGFNGFSYADVAQELKITTASLHYHFAGKAELGRALVDRYSQRFAAALERIDQELPSAAAKLQAYADLYATVLRERRLCLCGMLAAEYQTLPGPMRELVIRFFDDNEDWLSRVLDSGRTANELSFNGPPAEAARMVIGALEGAMLVARPYGEVGRLQSAARQLIAGLTTVASPG
jgi:TetR/AcrR family transcriptional repressor of nem operon